MTAQDADGLFDLPPGTRRPTARVVLMTGASGSGKSSLVRRLGLPSIQLDDFYHDHDHPDMPRRFGIADWDSPASWDADDALRALVELCTTGHADLPIYDIPTSTRTGTTHADVTGARVIVAEGIFASELVAACRAEGILADAVCITRPRLVTFWFRLLRDLGESRKPPLTLVRRGWGLMRDEPGFVRRWTSQGCRAVRVAQAEKEIRALAAA
ncbi:uridine kinase family protein [Sanguibacter inulinus]|uniref:ATP-binding protein n=1 Tax=Sanguibacter inulinus TaxID=60922 RepID=A0A853EZT7_9MICO|nr:ATP-binding protein [Sanguibacter inulinus]MBF0723173.1 ATP-binding protein [Sanguibacter inulinus]NYS94318.1 ATP-binding protein [Sanguibacter inulinus]